MGDTFKKAKVKESLVNLIQHLGSHLILCICIANKMIYVIDIQILSFFE